MLKTRRKRVNRYRTQTTHFVNFVCDVRELELYSHTKIEAQSKLKGLTIWNFETISFLHEINGFFHCVGYLNGVGYQLILTQK
jgi:hypothetical protein